MAKKLIVVERDQCIGCFSCMFACSRTWHNAMTTTKSAIRIRAYSGTDGSFSIRTCNSCEHPDCVAACPKGALTQKPNGALKLDADKCDSCRLCVEACLIDGLTWDNEKSLPLPCLQCGVCVKYCPNEVLAMAEREDHHVETNS